MDVKEMHIAFRTLGQQMGLQHVRGILPESIDVYLNAAQIDKVRAIIAEHAATQYKDKLSQRDNPVSPVASLKTLYANIVKETKYDNLIAGAPFSRYTFLMDFNPITITSVNAIYVDTNDTKQRFVGCRVIDYDKIGDTLYDYCNAPSDDFPVVSFRNTDGVFYGGLHGDVQLEINYIRVPKKIRYDSDNCELPEHLHTEVVELAVRKFFASVVSTSGGKQD